MSQARRIFGNDACSPRTWGIQVEEPAPTGMFSATLAETACTPGIAAMAAASAVDSVVAGPSPCWMSGSSFSMRKAGLSTGFAGGSSIWLESHGLAELKLPLLTTRMFMPAARTWFVIDRSAPLPTATIARTVATPIIRLTIVSTVCRRLRRSERKAIEELRRRGIGTSGHFLHSSTATRFGSKVE